MKEVPIYFHIHPGAALPDVSSLAPFRAVVIIEREVCAGWRAEVSNWLVRSGCLYMMAWGWDCSLWDDSVDQANIDRFSPEEIPEDRFVMTTWHSKELLVDVFWYCKRLARHPAVERSQVILLHIADAANGGSMIQAYDRS